MRNLRRSRRANDTLAEAVSTKPDRFGGFAAVPLQDVDAAVSELDRCIDQLGFKGVLINSWTNLSNGVGHLDEARFEPFWQHVEELNVPVYLHPRQLAADQRRIMDGRPELSGPVWEFGADCSASALRLITSGLFDRHPSVQVVLGHLGESLPYDISRIENRLNILSERNTLLRTPTEYLRENFHVTTSGHFCTASLRAAIAVMGVDRVMFSVDYPYESTEEAATWFDAVEFDGTDADAIGAGNARRLLKLQSGETP